MKAYTKDPEIAKKRGVHTIYTGNGEPIATKTHKVKGTVFVRGLAKDLEGQEYNKLKDLGHVTPNRPSDDED